MRFELSPAARAWISANWFRAAIAGSLILVAVSIGHYSMIALPAIKREQLAAQEKEERRRGLEATYNNVFLQTCLDDSQTNYVEGWDRASVIAACRLTVAFPGRRRFTGRSAPRSAERVLQAISAVRCSA